MDQTSAPEILSPEAQTEGLYSVIGCLIVLGGVLDNQMNALTAAVCHLSGSPMLEPVIASIEFARKCAIIKARCKLMNENAWRSALKSYTKKAEKAYTVRNIVAHSVLSLEDGEIVLRPTGAYKLLSGMDLDKQVADKTDLATLEKRYRGSEICH